MGRIAVRRLLDQGDEGAVFWLGDLVSSFD